MKQLSALILIILLVGGLSIRCSNEATIERIIGADTTIIYDSTDIVMYDTLTIVDTIIQYDSTNTIMYDTLTIVDTIIQYDSSSIEYIYDTTIVVDTFIVNVNHYDTTMINHYDTTIVVDTFIVNVNHYDTTIVVDTFIVNVNHYDTTIVVDTITDNQCAPFVQFAFAALQYYGNNAILSYINSEFGYTDGWIYYLGITQCDMQSPEYGVYEIYGYATYWTTDFSAYYPLEYFWKVSYISGDPSDPDNWELTDPPAQTSSLSFNEISGVKIATERKLK